MNDLLSPLRAGPALALEHLLANQTPVKWDKLQYSQFLAVAHVHSWQAAVFCLDRISKRVFAACSGWPAGLMGFWAFPLSGLFVYNNWLKLTSCCLLLSLNLQLLDKAFVFFSFSEQFCLIVHDFYKNELHISVGMNNLTFCAVQSKKHLMNKSFQKIQIKYKMQKKLN